MINNNLTLTINSNEVLAEDSWEAHADIRNFISNKAKHLEFEVLLEQFLLVHSFTAHEYEDLSAFVGVWVEEVLLDILHYLLLLADIIIELLKDVDKTGRRSGADLSYVLIAELEEHRKEAIIDCFRVE